jgi:NADH-quinone oxidoreductase subunit A
MTPLAAYALLFVAVGAGFIFVHLLAGKLIRPSKPDAEKGTIYECGEPTIGSAWVQFDLRFYVVALLFVIFDVEVAFFFPWAEVFGKANAIATQDAPKDAAGYNEYGRRMLDLTPPAPTGATGSADESPQARERARLKGLSELTDADLEALRGLTREQKAALQKLSQADLQALLKPTPEAGAVLEKLAPADRTALEGLSPEAKTALSKVRTEALGGQMPLKDGEFGRNRAAASGLAWMAFFEVFVFFGVLLVGFAYLWRRGDLAWVRSLGERPAAPVPGPNGAPAPPTAPPTAVTSGPVLVSAAERS